MKNINKNTENTETTSNQMMKDIEIIIYKLTCRLHELASVVCIITQILRALLSTNPDDNDPAVVELKNTLQNIAIMSNGIFDDCTTYRNKLHDIQKTHQKPTKKGDQ